LHESGRLGSQQFNADDRSNEVEPSSKSLPTISVTLRQDAENFELSIDVFRHHAQSYQVEIVLTLMVQRPLRRLSDRNTATRVSLGDALITPYRLSRVALAAGSRNQTATAT